MKIFHFHRKSLGGRCSSGLALGAGSAPWGQQRQHAEISLLQMWLLLALSSWHVLPSTLLGCKELPKALGNFGSNLVQSIQGQPQSRKCEPFKGQKVVVLLLSCLTPSEPGMRVSPVNSEPPGLQPHICWGPWFPTIRSTHAFLARKHLFSVLVLPRNDDSGTFCQLKSLCTHLMLIYPWEWERWWEQQHSLVL